jgi:hypothetical protein
MPAALMRTTDNVTGTTNMTAISDQPDIHIRAVPRRVMIRCPLTDEPVDTGHEPASAPTIRREVQLLVDCTECGQDHMWRMEDAFLGP